MNGQDFLRIVHSAFKPSLESLGFSMDPPAISGRHYRASFTGKSNSVWVSYEPGDNEFFIFIFTRENGILSDIDDRKKTPRLADLNVSHMPSISGDEHARNEEFFRGIEANGKEEKFLLKCAKELRLVLPKHLGS
ncbi:MAG: hypothetical protein ACOY33_09180 [Pseudomonadota bacterium]